MVIVPLWQIKILFSALYNVGFSFLLNRPWAGFEFGKVSVTPNNPVRHTKPQEHAPAPGPTLSASDAEWVEWIDRIARRDEAALCSLYEAAVGRVYGLALRITGNAAVAEEVVESVFFQVWNTAASYDAARGRPLTWLLVICRSQGIGRLRSADGAMQSDDFDALLDTVPDEKADPQSILLAVEQNSHLQQALTSLASRDRQLVALAFFRGLSYSEIAAQMTMPLGTVKTRIRHALQCLREQLNPLNLRG